jgi:competence protein ComGC
MRSMPIYKSEAFTRIELMLVILVLSVLLWTFVRSSHPAHSSAQRISCINNLKEIGTAYRIWAGDNNDLFPASQSMTNGGWRELLTNADQGFRCSTNFAIMADEMGQSPRIIVCPSDVREPANSFSDLVSNTNLSYFVGVSANYDAQSQWLLGGDRNLGAGTEPDRNCGFSPESGQGNDVAIQTNSKSGPVCWSLKLHSRGTSAGAGNILMADESVQQITSASFRSNCQPNAGQTTNWPVGHAPASPSIRVLFP